MIIYHKLTGREFFEGLAKLAEIKMPMGREKVKQVGWAISFKKEQYKGPQWEHSGMIHSY